jgi:hypothetical protein
LAAGLFVFALSTKDVGITVGAAPGAREPVVETVHSTIVEDGAPCPATPPTDCGGKPCVLDIKESAKASINLKPFLDLKDALERPDTTVRIGPNVELDFDGLGHNFDGLGHDYFPLRIERCVTLMSVDSFEPIATTPVLDRRKPTGPKLKQPASSRRVAQRRSRRTVARRRGVRSRTTSANRNVARTGIGENVGPIDDLEVEQPARIGSGRTPKSSGPLFNFGTNHPKDALGREVKTFFELRCDGTFTGDGVRISGFRLYGKSFGDQGSGETGIQNLACINFEISNMEIAGWGEAAIKLIDIDSEVPQEPGGRITQADQIRIFGNYIHHNQHETGFPLVHTHPGDTVTTSLNPAGYGVAVQEGAWAYIYKNVFDYNRHAIAADGKAGGYTASHNLVLKGGGIHGRFWNQYTHQFDIHGDENCGISGWGGSAWNCGHAGFEVVYESNAFQYRKDNAIKVRGKPRTRGYFGNNIFPHEGFHKDKGDDAIALYSTKNIGFSGNKINIDTFGDYGVCDFDGDGIDDLFLATGATWWYSSKGQFPWSYMNTKVERLSAVRLGYFDNDLRCDVLTERDGQLIYSSGGYGDWQTLGKFDAPLSQVTFGRFDPAQTDNRRLTTHAFWQRSTTHGSVASLASRSASTRPVWTDIQSSGKQLQFGDFTGDGVTDVIAVVGGHWQYSVSGREPWHDLNAKLGDSVSQLKIANMDPDDNIDDILKLERKTTRFFVLGRQYEKTTLSWWRSKNGRKESWDKFKEYVFYFPVSKQSVSPRFGYLGRFAQVDHEGRPVIVGGTLVIGNDRFGSFYSELGELKLDSRSKFAY